MSWLRDCIFSFLCHIVWAETNEHINGWHFHIRILCDALNKEKENKINQNYICGRHGSSTRSQNRPLFNLLFCLIILKKMRFFNSTVFYFAFLYVPLTNLWHPCCSTEFRLLCIWGTRSSASFKKKSKSESRSTRNNVHVLFTTHTPLAL